VSGAAADRRCSFAGEAVRGVEDQLHGHGREHADFCLAARRVSGRDGPLDPVLAPIGALGATLEGDPLTPFEPAQLFVGTLDPEPAGFVVAS